MRTKIQLNEKEIEIRIQFQHSQFDHNTEKMDKIQPTNHTLLNGLTECHLVREDAVIIGIGVSYCTINDVFCKETGRKIALTRAIAESFIPKTERKKIWEVYLNRAKT